MVLDWRDDYTLRVGELTFTLATAHDFEGLCSHGTTFVLLKDRPFVEQYARLFAEEPLSRVLEFGIYHGGSLLLLHHAFGAEKIVGIDVSAPAAELDGYLTAAGLREQIVTHFGTSQADGPAVRRIIAEEFRGHALDVVVDDASHDLALTRAGFHLAFPYLRPGGLYVIEDWGWAHWPAPTWQKQTWLDRPALSNLVFELVMACTSSRTIISRVDVSPYFVAVRKGPAAVDPATFDLATLYVARGKSLNLL